MGCGERGGGIAEGDHVLLRVWLFHEGARDERQPEFFLSTRSDVHHPPGGRERKGGLRIGPQLEHLREGDGYVPGVIVTDGAVREGGVDPDPVAQVEDVVEKVLFESHEDVVLGGVHLVVGVYGDDAAALENVDGGAGVGGDVVSPVSGEGDGSARQEKELFRITLL